MEGKFLMTQQQKMVKRRMYSKLESISSKYENLIKSDNPNYFKLGIQSSISEINAFPQVTFD